MQCRTDIVNGILWAGAIVAAAILGSPTFLTMIVLPSLAICSIIFVMPRTKQPKT